MKMRITWLRRIFKHSILPTDEAKCKRLLPSSRVTKFTSFGFSCINFLKLSSSFFKTFFDIKYFHCYKKFYIWIKIQDNNIYKKIII